MVVMGPERPGFPSLKNDELKALHQKVTVARGRMESLPERLRAAWLYESRRSGVAGAREALGRIVRGIKAQDPLFIEMEAAIEAAAKVGDSGFAAALEVFARHEGLLDNPWRPELPTAAATSAAVPGTSSPKPAGSVCPAVRRRPSPFEQARQQFGCPRISQVTRDGAATATAASDAAGSPGDLPLPEGLGQQMLPDGPDGSVVAPAPGGDATRKALDAMPVTTVMAAATSTSAAPRRKEDVKAKSAMTRAVLEGLRILAGFDRDRAREHNGVGFSGRDSDFGHQLARQTWLSPLQTEAGRRLLLKYHRQLPEGLMSIYRSVP